MQLFQPPDETRLEGSLDKVSFQNDDGTWTVGKLRFDDGGRRGTATVVGNLMGARPGERLRLRGRWKDHATFGRQFEVTGLEIDLPVTAVGIQKYLSNADGIGPVLAKRIVKKFGTDTLDVIGGASERLVEVRGIGATRLEQIREAWARTQAEREVTVFLLGHGVTPAYAKRIIDEYGDEAILKVQKDPYGLARDIHGIGFLLADNIAKHIGLEGDDPRRVKAGVSFVLGEALKEGHLFLPLEDLKKRASETLKVSTEHVALAIEALGQAGRVIREPTQEGGDGAVYPRRAWESERACAEEVTRLLKTGASAREASNEARDTAIARAEAHLGIELADAQRRAAEQVMDHAVLVITGGPGTGKTTMVRAICAIGEDAHLRMLLAAPTGRAARRLGETTGRPAKTIHRTLEFSFREGGFQRNKDKKLAADLVIVDEASMVDIDLMRALVEAIPSGCRLVLVGDVDQLPSVGAGDVLADLIRSEVVPVVRLNTVFRQAEASAIIRNAHRIIGGLRPEEPVRGSGEDFFLVAAKDAEDVLSKTLKIVTERVPEAFGFDPLQDVQVIAPMHRGTVGCHNLNIELQAKLNGGARPFQHRDRTFCVGDRVMQVRNDYDKDVFNGDVGRVGRIVADDRGERGFVVSFDGRDVEYVDDDIDSLVLAYAITAHKSQGSEYPVVVIALTTGHFMLLERNLLYTALTRAQKLAVVVTMERALHMALNNQSSSRRNTRLDARLRDLA